MLARQVFRTICGIRAEQVIITDLPEYALGRTIDGHIEINCSSPEDERIATLLHEILHQCPPYNHSRWKSVLGVMVDIEGCIELDTRDYLANYPVIARYLRRFVAEP